MSAAWAAYYAQYSNLLNQAGGQPGAVGAAAGMPFAAAGQNLMGAASAAQQPQVTNPHTPADSHHSTQATQSQVDPSQAGATAPAVGGAASGQQDFSDQWIEFYLMNGRPDYAEQIMEMKKQQQAQKQQQSLQH